MTRINLLAVGEQARISAECVECLQLAMRASALTSGKFHPFLGAAALRVKGGAPPYLKDALKTSSASVSAAAIQMDPTDRRVGKLEAGTLLDLGGIGKGFALDEAMREMEDWEAPRIMASFGGSTLLFRSCGPGDRWTGSLGEQALAPFLQGAISSSGIGFQGEHIVGAEGVSSCWQRCFARSGSAALADALSTGSMLMDRRELETLCEAESDNLSLAAMRDGETWGADRFCRWGPPA